jgi:integrase
MFALYGNKTWKINPNSNQIPIYGSWIRYGGGLRIMECSRLRFMDLDFAKAQVYVRSKGGKDRMTILPPSICEDLEAHLSRVKKLHEADLDAGHGDVYLPEALARKYGEVYPSREESPENPVENPIAKYKHLCQQMDI